MPGIGILWQYESEFDDALIATNQLLVAGGQDRVVILDRKNGQELWRADVEGNVTGLAATDSLLTVSTDLGHIYAFSTDQTITDPLNWPIIASEPFAPMQKRRFTATLPARLSIVVVRKPATVWYSEMKMDASPTNWRRAVALNVIAVEPDAKRAQAVREVLEKTGLNGSRITIVNKPFEELPFSNYFANLVVSDTHLRTGEMPCKVADIAAFVKPCGGVAMLGLPGGDSSDIVVDENSPAQTWLEELLRVDEGEISRNASWLLFRRGKLPGAGQWSHQYGNVANTSLSNDERVRDGLGVLWYGDPGPSSMINRHEAAGAPLSTNGRMFIQGIDSVMAYDAYNGDFLWEYENPGAIRTGVFNNRETHNLAASDDVLYVAVDDTCIGLDAATGEVASEFKTPASEDGIDRAWAYLAYDQGQVFGTSTIREELEEKLRPTRAHREVSDRCYLRGRCCNRKAAMDVSR